MRRVFENFVMYSDSPRRHYRQITALFEDGMFKCSRWEGEILHAEPFEKTNPDAEILICARSMSGIGFFTGIKVDSLCLVRGSGFRAGRRRFARFAVAWGG